jgi:Protein of unknown function (DUF4058)
MPIHNWSRTPPGFFHHFHQFWSVEVCNALNDGRLPQGFYALVEQRAIGLVPDVLTLEHQPRSPGAPSAPVPRGRLAVADAPPKARFVSRAEEDVYAAKANRVVVRTSAGRVVAVIEILSPGNKSTRYAVRSFVEKTLDLLRQDINVLVVDLFPPSPRDPQGIHPLIWEAVLDEPFELPPDKPLTLAAYVAGVPWTAYVEPVAVGDSLPDMPVFLDADTYVLVPLDPTYRETWDRCPREFKDAVLAAAR